MLVTLGIAMLVSIFTYGASSVTMFHTILVLAFAIPGASWGYDCKPTSRSVALWLCVWATVGTLVMSAYVLMRGFY